MVTRCSDTIIDTPAAAADQLHPLNDEKYILRKNDYLDFLSGLRPILAGYRREWV